MWMGSHGHLGLLTTGSTAPRMPPPASALPPLTRGAMTSSPFPSQATTRTTLHSERGGTALLTGRLPCVPVRLPPRPPVLPTVGERGTALPAPLPTVHRPGPPQEPLAARAGPPDRPWPTSGARASGTVRTGKAPLAPPTLISRTRWTPRTVHPKRSSPPNGRMDLRERDRHTARAVMPTREIADRSERRPARRLPARREFWPSC